MKQSADPAWFTEEKMEILKAALDKCCAAYLKEIETTTEEEVVSYRFKRNINRLFREKGGLPIRYSEVDNLYERVRSRIVRVWLVILNGIRKLLGRKSKIL